MNWIFLAIAGAGLMGASNILDSHLLSKRMGLRIFLLLMGITVMLVGLAVFFMFPFPGDISSTVLLIAIAQAVARILGVAIMFYVFRQEEVSRAIPVIYIYPIFVALMSVPLLGEILHSLDWLAVLIVVAGAIMISVRRRQIGGFTLTKPFWLLICAGLLFAMTDVASKYVLSSLSFYNLFALTSVCMGGVSMFVLVNAKTRKEYSVIKRRNSAIALLVLDQGLSTFGVLFGLWALQLGPVALVSTIGASRPVFVLLYSLILSRISPMFLQFAPGKGLLVLRIVAAGMVAGGIAIIYLT